MLPRICLCQWLGRCGSGSLSFARVSIWENQGDHQKEQRESEREREREIENVRDGERDCVNEREHRNE